MATRRLPLFPLSLVLLPGMTLPIRVFEPRYRQMLRACLRDDRRFGVALIRRGRETGDHNVEPNLVGTIAEIQNIGSIRRGALPVTVLGERRFQVLELDRSLPYLVATVEVLDEGSGSEASRELVESAESACRSYMSVLMAARGMWHREIQPPSDPTKLAYFMGMLCETAPARSLQALLDGQSPDARLQSAIALLEEHQVRLEPAIMRAGPGAEESLFSSN